MFLSGWIASVVYLLFRADWQSALFLLLCTILFVLVAIPNLRPDKVHLEKPWIVVDHKSRRVLLPRGDKSLPFDKVVRLQVIGFSIRRRKRGREEVRAVKSDTGEVQILFYDGNTLRCWCIVTWPAPAALAKFAAVFTETTGIPFYRIYFKDHRWHAEPYPGTPVPAVDERLQVSEREPPVADIGGR